MVLFLGRIPIIPYLKGKKRNQMVCLILNHRKIEPLFLWSPEVFDCTAHQLKRKKKKMLGHPIPTCTYTVHTGNAADARYKTITKKDI